MATGHEGQFRPGDAAAAVAAATDADAHAAAEVIAPVTDPVPPGLAGRLIARLSRNRFAGELGWVTGAYVYVQGARLVTNVILAHLLAPQLFGIMLIVNTLRTGIELLSDIGVGQNIVSNPRGGEPTFFNTAWTLQMIRGVLLAALVLVFAAPIAHFYEDPQLTVIVPLMATLFLLTGFQSPAHFLLQKQGQVRRYVLFDCVVQTASVAINIALAIWTPTIWALVFGLILSTVVSTLGSYLLMDPRQFRPRLDRAVTHEVLSFGKWVFASSLVFFLAMNFDRLYFAKAIPFAVLGVYGVARTFSDFANLFVQRIGSVLLFPKIAASQQAGASLRATLARPRRAALAILALMLAVAVAGADRLILTLYDQRYHAAAFMLPVMMAGVWFAILSAIGEAVMMGTGKPAHAAQANAAKLVFTIVALPLALHRFGMAGAIGVIASGELARYLSLSFSQHRQRLSFVRQDIALTALFVALILVWRLAFTAIGLVPDPVTWWSYGAALHG